MKPTETLFWLDARGNRVERDVNMTLDVRDFLGTPGYSLLVVAANIHLSVEEIRRYLACTAINKDLPFIERGRNWIQKRRWAFQKPGTDNTKHDLTARMPGALELMSANPEMSLRDLAKLMRERGFNVSREWVRRNRCRVSDTHSPHR